jgi:DNA mismatch endonuclease (patch repair protein)
MGYIFKNLTPIRSKVMRSIKGINTSIEIKLRKKLSSLGLRYRVNYRSLPGSPDIIFQKQKIAIFCDSDFWHGKNLERKRKTIKNNRDYWIKKIKDNIERDKKNNKKLRKLGWRVFRFWETEINTSLDRVMRKIIKSIAVTKK